MYALCIHSVTHTLSQSLQAKVKILVYLRETFTLPVKNVHNLDPLQIISDIKTHDSESRGQEEAGRTRDEQVSYLHVAPL